MTPDLWDGHGPVIADTSAWITARRIPAAREAMLDAIERGDVTWCWPVRYELTVDARDAEASTALDRTLDGMREIRVDLAMQRDVLAAMRELAIQQAHDANRLPLTDLTVAVAARVAGLDVAAFRSSFRAARALLDICVWWRPPQAPDTRRDTVGRGQGRRGFHGANGTLCETPNPTRRTDRRSHVSGRARRTTRGGDNRRRARQRGDAALIHRPASRRPPPLLRCSNVTDTGSEPINSPSRRAMSGMRAIMRGPKGWSRIAEKQSAEQCERCRSSRRIRSGPRRPSA